MKPGLKRLFVVLTPLWIGYCLVVYPMQRQAQAEQAEIRESSKAREQLKGLPLRLQPYLPHQFAEPWVGMQRIE